MHGAAANSRVAMPESSAISPPGRRRWRRSTQDLRRRAVADKTRRAYAIDSGQFAAWASARELTPAAVDLRALRRYAAGLSEQGAAPTTVARKLAALRGLFRVQMELGQRSENPADLLSSPKRAQRLPRVLRSAEVAALLDRIPQTTPLELRDRALFELAYASGLRAEELVSLDVESIEFDSETVRVEGKGGKTRLVPVGEHALAALERYLARGRPALDRRRGDRALFLSKSGTAAEHVRRAAPAAHLGPAGRGAARRRWPTRIRTRCATRSRPICWRAGPICGRSRNCSATRRYRRRRSTLG